MKTKNKILTILQLLLITATTFAQESYLIRGIIKDSTSSPIPYASVGIKGSIDGTATKDDGSFSLKTNRQFPFTIIISSIGYKTQEFEVKDKIANLVFSLNSQSVIANEVVVSASRIEESQLKSPVSIEKLDIRAIKETAAPTFFDALENVKGVQMTTVSLGFKVPNSRGFNGTTNSRFLQLVDGVDVTSPGVGAPIANTVGPTELDIQSVELIPGAASAIYGLNAVNGVANLKTKSPFYHQGLSVYQKTGVNHINDSLVKPQLLTETAIRYAKAFNNKFAFKINGAYSKGYDWIANNQTDLNASVNEKLGLAGLNNPGLDPINSYGNESSDRKDVKMANGKTYTIARTGYKEKDLTDYTVQNLKADVSLNYKLNSKNELSYSYRIGQGDNIFQRGNRIRLEGLTIQQHKLELTGVNYFVRAYTTEENTGSSYALRPLGENLDRNFKSDTKWYADYTTAFNSAVSAGQTIATAHTTARANADKGRYQPGTARFDSVVKVLNGINNWILDQRRF